MRKTVETIILLLLLVSLTHAFKTTKSSKVETYLLNYPQSHSTENNIKEMKTVNISSASAMFILLSLLLYVFLTSDITVKKMNREKFLNMVNAIDYRNSTLEHHL